MEAETAAWGSTALTVYLEKLGKPRCTSFSWTTMMGEDDATWRHHKVLRGSKFHILASLLKHTPHNCFSNLHSGQGCCRAINCDFSRWVQVWEQQLSLVWIEAWFYRQSGTNLHPREGTALQARLHQQVGHGDAEYTGLLVSHGLQGHGACVEAWGIGQK